MTAILGISAFYHDAAAAIVVNGKVVAAAQEERFSRIKHDASFPTQAIEYCLQAAGLSPAELDHVGFYEKPLLKFDRLLDTYLSYAPLGFQSFLKAMPQWVGQKLHLRREIQRGLQSAYRGRVSFCQHHQSHAASAFFPSPFEEAAILTMDGVGEWATTCLGIGRNNTIQLTDEIRFPHSLGLLYSAFTYYCGFRVNSGEYKLMGLAPYGEPQYVDVIRDHLVDIRDDGSFQLNLKYFNYCAGLTMTGPRFHKLFGRGPRPADASIDTLDMDLAASIQVVAEEIVLKTANHLYRKTGLNNLCLAGGVALNCVANGKLVREGPFEQVWAQPAAGDAGGALGVALLIAHQLLGDAREPDSTDSQQASLLGPRFSSHQVEQVLKQFGAAYQRVQDASELAQVVASNLADGKIVGRFSGRMEFGPRALGNRSILADPRSGDMQSRLNLKTKFRESFRPFAPAILLEHAADFFDLPEGMQSPYMQLVFEVARQQRREVVGAHAGLERVNDIRSTIPAVTHVDHSARVQTVNQNDNPSFRALLQSFYEKTGCPVLINTSFNVRGEPIVCSPEDAIRCFMKTQMDVLVIEDFVLTKAKQPSALVARFADQPSVQAHND